MEPSTVLLIGPEAEALAPRLEASGYRTRRPGGNGTVTDEMAAHDVNPATDGGITLADITLAGEIAVAVLSAEAAGGIPALRQQLGPIPILLDLGCDSQEGRSRCLSAGADDFWLSSQGPSDLLMRLRLHARLQNRPRVIADLLQLADLKVNTDRRQVHRGGRRIALTTREYQLLLFMLERAGQVLGRDEILRGVWSDQQGAASNVAEVYVRYLRQKLEAAGERRLIHTVRGRGYCLAAGQPPLTS